MIPVTSSNLAAVGYDDSDASLYVQFKNGTTYQYLRVPHAIYDALMRAGSKGTFFNDEIKERFPFRQV